MPLRLACPFFLAHPLMRGTLYSIDSLVVCTTEVKDLSRMCIVLRGQDGVVEQARRQLEDLVGQNTSPKLHPGLSVTDSLSL